MFLVGYDMVGGYYPFDANISSHDYTMLEIKDVVIDEASADLGNKEFTVEKGEWQSNTAFLATFNGTLEAGNLSMGDTDVDTLRFKKRKKGEMEWLLIDEIAYEKTQQIYVVRDRLARANIEYEYCIVPVVGTVEGTPITNSIVAMHEGLWVVDANTSVNIFCEVDYGSINHNTNIATFELLDNKYPLVIAGELDYLSGTTSGRLLTRESWNQHKMDYEAEMNLRESVFEFMKNGKPKIMKNNTGRYYLIAVNGVTENPYKLDDASVTISYNWVEIGNAEDLQTLVDCDLLPEQLVSG